MSQVRVSINAIQAGYALAQAVLAGGENAMKLAQELKADVERLSGESVAHGGAIEAARSEYANDDLEIDDQPILSIGDEGIWVNAWVWVPTKSDEDQGQ